MKLTAILWDFDGVILDSMGVRDEAFRVALESYPCGQVEALVEYHQRNGGLSRFHKFRVFFEEIRREEVADDRIEELASVFSGFCMERLSQAELLIKETIDFIAGHYEDLEFHIVSGSAQSELKQLCEALGIGKYFGEILGSPTPKIRLVKELMLRSRLKPETTGLVGDSENDHEAAVASELNFFGFRNEALVGKGTYLWSMDDLRRFA